MSSAMSRYSKHYINILRSDTAGYFPIHNFLRNPNIKTKNDILNYHVTHDDVLRTTVHKVNERFGNSELYIVGTMNSSNILANRTRRMIKELSPDVVFVQATEKWWNAVKNLEYVNSQKEMDKANDHLSIISGIGCLKKSVRFQLFNFLAKSLFAMNLEQNPFLPGLEVKYALEEAVKCNAKIVFLGHEFDENTIGLLHHEKRLTLFSYFSRLFSLPKAYKSELFEYNIITKNKGWNSFVESSFDVRTCSWFIKIFEAIFPEMKRIFVDKRDIDISQIILENKGKKMIALVNQHHMEGIEHHWCHSFGGVPTLGNELAHEKINVISDMPLRKMLYTHMYHVIKRDVKSSRMRSSPASFTNEINIYHREFNFQYEHRNM